MKCSLVFKEVISRGDLLKNLIIRNLKIRYKGSVLGFFWSLLDPLFMMLVYLLFIKLMRFSVELPVLLTGVIVWQFFSMCANDSINTITGSTNLVKKVYFPRIILPLAMVIANLINFLLSLGVLLIILLFLKTPISMALAWIPFIVLFQFIFCVGISLTLCTLNVFFRDIEHLMGVIMMTWFFLTPIIYPISKVPPEYINLYFLNPMATLITFYRYSFLGKELPQIGSSLIVIIVFFLAGIFIFTKYQKYFADEL